MQFIKFISKNIEIVQYKIKSKFHDLGTCLQRRVIGHRFPDVPGEFGVTPSDDDAPRAEFLGHGSRMGHEQYGDILLRHDLVHAFLAFPGKLAVTDR